MQIGDKIDKTTKDQIEELGKLQFSEDEVCIILEFEGNEIPNIYKRPYERGRLLAEAEIRRASFKNAKQGSTPAQKQFFELVDRS